MAGAVVIDLTGDESDASQAASTPGNTTPVRSEVTPATSTSPPAFARGVRRPLSDDDSPPVSPPPPKKACFDYDKHAFDVLIPIVSYLAKTLPNNVYDVDKIISQAVILLMKSSFFRQRMDETNGALTSCHLDTIKSDAKTHIDQLKTLSEFKRSVRPLRRFSTSKLDRLGRTSYSSAIGLNGTPNPERRSSTPITDERGPPVGPERSYSSPLPLSLPLGTPSKLKLHLMRPEPSFRPERNLPKRDIPARRTSPRESLARARSKSKLPTPKRQDTPSQRHLGYIFPPSQRQRIKDEESPKAPRRDVKRFLTPRQAEDVSLSNWFSLPKRPYRDATERESIAEGSTRWLNTSTGIEALPAVYHVDFTSAEIADVIHILEDQLQIQVPTDSTALSELVWKHDVPSIIGDAMRGRTEEDVRNLCSDLLAGHLHSPFQARMLSLAKEKQDQRIRSRGLRRIPQLLLARELEGNNGFGRMRQYCNFQSEFATCHEDKLTTIAEFTNCAGDIAAMTWVSGNVICGTTTHSDTHNQQYNKPGNLLLCSTRHGTLRAFPDHRIPRPLVSKGENASEAMRRSQDPWIYSSVVSTDHDEVNNLAFTSSFDRTVKAWSVSEDGSLMTALATWHHTGNVNFVAVAKDGSGRVASAADTATEAVRVYTVDPGNIGESPYYTISCARKDADGSDKWAYFPATMQWGLTPATFHLLAIGYSPRSLSGDDNDIPEDKLRSGEILLWDAARRCQVPVSSATTTNVFEVLWHPLLPQFIVATSPCGLKTGPNVRTEVHLFRLDLERQDGAYKEFQCLGCPASDINELTIMPNSTRHAYISAACTDGRVYVWDTAQGDLPIHVLVHGHPLDDFFVDREKEDTGVKFTAWGRTPDRFYTGASDGVVKVWNIRNRRAPFVRNLLHAPGPISHGAFCPNHTKLAIGDATGRVYLLSLDVRDEFDSHFITLPGHRRVRRPQAFIRHPEPPAPESSDAELEISEAEYARQKYIESGQLIRHPNPVIGFIQGPLYHMTQLFRIDAHTNSDPRLCLLPEYERMQQGVEGYCKSNGRLRLRRLRLTWEDGDDNETHARHAQHEDNMAKDLDMEEPVLQELLADGAQLIPDGQEGWEFTYEEMPDWLE